jgi:hypothetical protein
MIRGTTWLAVVLAGCTGKADAPGADADSDTDGRVCAGSVRWGFEGGPTGLEGCPSDTVHRVDALACEANPGGDPCGATFSWEEVCIDASGRSCVAYFNETESLCFAGCVTDDDCDAGEACICRSPDLDDWSRCVPATCRTDADCDGRPCAVDFDVCNRPAGLHCESALDDCAARADCPHGDPCEWVDADGRWECTGGGACE